MQLLNGRHLSYCTNIHRGESWPETLANLEQHTLAVRRRVCPDQPYAIGLRLGEVAARELSDPATLAGFQHWLDRHGCYVFTINGFPYGRFHGTRVKERAYAPDWTTRERLEYTNLLFDLLATLVPAGVEGSVSTVPGSFKAFIQDGDQERAMRRNLWRCVEHIAAVSEASGRRLHLGLEPEPLCYLETTAETVCFFDQLRDDRPTDHRIEFHLGVNYDACHLAVEFEAPDEALARLRKNGIMLSKIHLSSALKVQASQQAVTALGAFADDTYFHQLIARAPGGAIRRFRDLPEFLAQAGRGSGDAGEEWRVHYHIPLHATPRPPFQGTTDHLLGLMDAVAADPALCRHFEMETYTWEVMPAELRHGSVVDQLVAEYAWVLTRFTERGIRPASENAKI